MLHGEAPAHGTTEPHAIYCWNVHGLKPEKLRLPEVSQILSTCCVLVLTETWLQSDDEIPAELSENFICFGLYNEKQSNMGRHSGGILVCVHKRYSNASVFRTHAVEGILWLKFTGTTRLNPGFYLAACYFPPADSTRWKRHRVVPFDTLREDVLDVCNLGSKFVICGDMNARTGCRPDSMNTDMRDPALFNLFCPTELITPPPRASMDAGVNNFGLKLVELCIASELIILNGRLPGDASGTCTFQSKSTDGSSLIDYFLAHPQLAFDTSGSPLPGVSLCVHQHSDFTTISDHVPVSLTLPHGTLPEPRGQPNQSQRQRRRQRDKRKRWVWKEEQATTYATGLASGDGARFLDQLLACDDVDGMINYFKSAIHTAATAAGLPQRPLIAAPSKSRPRERTTAPWYNAECISAHARITRATCAADMLQAARSYRLTVRRAKRYYSRAREARLIDLLKHKPKLFWQAVKHSPSTACTIGMQQSLDYFRALRQPKVSPDAVPDTTTRYTHNPRCEPHALDLDVDYSTADIERALAALKDGKAADCYGDIAELLTKAKLPGSNSFLLVPHLTRIFNAIFRSGKFPLSESMGMITQIYKGKGDADNCTNYRGITIISVLAKLYAILLNNRLAAFRLASPSRRARGQGGFLTDHRTTDHLFVLQHFIDTYRSRNKPLYSCFVDLSKAFDTISRPLLWQRLSDVGIRGSMLSALQAYYADVRECVKSADGLTADFPSDIGVKQGCPLSPTLFGLYIDAVEDFVYANISNGGSVRVDGVAVSILLYADDIVFLASTQAELQQLLDIFSDFCTTSELTVNLAKTEVLVFSRSRVGVKANIYYRQQLVPQKTKYKYLGIIFTATHGAKFGGEALLGAARHALFALEKQIRLDNITNPQTAFHLFDALVAPILLYGSEIWGCYGKAVEADALHIGFLKRILRLPYATDTLTVLSESGRLPMHVKLAEAQARFWQRLHALADTTRLLHLAFTAHRQLMQKKPKCWGIASYAFISNIIDIDNISEPPPSASAVRTSAQRRLNLALSEPVYMGISDHRDLYTNPILYQHAEHERRRTYARWFWTGGGRAAAMDIQDAAARRELTRFRLGAHGLQVTKAAWASGGNMDRINRLCKCCSMGIVEDEVHLIFECPLYDDIRQRFGSLFRSFSVANGDGYFTIIFDSSTEVMMQRFMRQANQLSVAKFVRKCMSARTMHNS
jgi:hypothetical protein